MAGIWNDLLRVLFPKQCCICNRRLGEGEKEFCLECSRNFSRTGDEVHPNPLDDRFMWLEGFVSAYARFYYGKGAYMQRLVHAIKYRDRPEAGYFLARSAAEELMRIGDPASTAEVLVPVPLHKSRKRERGYNQAEWIARGISEVWKIPVDNRSLVRNRNNTTQTHESATGRWQNTAGIFRLARPDLAGKHVLLIDDVITTGSTVIHCAETLLQAEGTRVSIFALARVQ